jgi:hypothetical protein
MCSEILQRNTDTDADDYKRCLKVAVPRLRSHSKVTPCINNQPPVYNERNYQECPNYYPPCPVHMLYPLSTDLQTAVHSF